MTQPDPLATLAALAEKATPGPWTQGSLSRRCRMPEHGSMGHPGLPHCKYEDEIMRGYPYDRCVSVVDACRELIGWTEDGPQLDRPEDAAFIAACRNLVPGICAELEAARKVVEAVRVRRNAELRADWPQSQDEAILLALSAYDAATRQEREA